MSEDTVKAVQVKLVLLGEAAVGKSSLVLRFVSNDFNENTSPTIGAAFLTQKCRLEDRVVKFEIWDTAGQERFHSLAPMYYRNAQAAVVVYDITKASSLEKAKSWVKELQRQASPNIVIALVGNKLDLVAESDAAGSSAAKTKASKPKAGAADADADDDAEADADAEAAALTSDDETDAAGDAAADAESDSESLRQISTAEASAYAREANLLFYEASAKTGANVKELFDEIARAIPVDTPAGGAGGAGAGGAAGGTGGAGGARGRREGQEVRLGDEAAKKGGCC